MFKKLSPETKSELAIIIVVVIIALFVQPALTILAIELIIGCAIFIFLLLSLLDLANSLFINVFRK